VPTSGAGCPPDQLGGVPEVDRRDPPRAQRRQHDELGLDGDGERSGRGSGQRAGVAGGQDEDPVGAQGDRLRDGRVVGQTAVDERAPVAAKAHRRQSTEVGAVIVPIARSYRLRASAESRFRLREAQHCRPPGRRRSCSNVTIGGLPSVGKGRV
jgi:hypothetical protein